MRGDPLIQVLAVAFTALSLLVLCLSLALLAMIAIALTRRILSPRARWYPYRIILHAGTLRVCALVLLLAQAGLWLVQLGDSEADAYFPFWVLGPFLLLGLLSLPRKSALMGFISSAEGGVRFPHGPIHGLLVRAKAALYVTAWAAMMPAVLAYNLPLDAFPNVGVWVLFSMLLLFPPLLLLNDDWIRARISRSGRG